MVHDVQGSMANLRSLVQKAITPHTNRCVICSHGAEFLADGTKDNIALFRYDTGWDSNPSCFTAFVPLT